MSELTPLTEERAVIVPPTRFRSLLRGLSVVAFYVLAVTIVPIIIAGISYIANYQPLNTGSYKPGRSCVDAIEVWVPEPHRRIDVGSVTCRLKGATVAWGFSLENGGPIPIRVRYVHYLRDPGAAGPLDPLTVELHDPVADNGSEDFQPFAPFTLEPGDQRLIRFSSRLNRDCGDVYTIMPTVVLTYEVLGITRHDELLAPVQLRVCPGLN
jgi:hypothetical protein